VITPLILSFFLKLCNLKGKGNLAIRDPPNIFNENISPPSLSPQYKKKEAPLKEALLCTLDSQCLISLARAKEQYGYGYARNGYAPKGLRGWGLKMKIYVSKFPGKRIL